VIATAKISCLPRIVVEAYISKCPCQLTKKNTSKPKLNPIISEQFWERVQLDLIDMRSSPAKSGHTFIFHAMDHFTKWHVLQPLLRKDKESVASCLLTHVFPIYGLPKILQMDNGREFVNSLILKVVKEWPGSCSIINGRPRHPQTQGIYLEYFSHILNVI
jgi:hypothetical protein